MPATRWQEASNRLDIFGECIHRHPPLRNFHGSEWLRSSGSLLEIGITRAR